MMNGFEDYSNSLEVVAKKNKIIKLDMNKLDELLKLKELLDLGIITDNDFNRKKAELLSDDNTGYDNSDSIKEEDIIIGENEKECPTCEIIIDKESEICKFCDYDFINKNNIKNNEDKIDKIKIKKYFLILILMIIIIFAGILIIGSIFPNNNSEIKNDTVPKAVTIDSLNIISTNTTLSADPTAPAANAPLEEQTNENKTSYNNETDYVEKKDIGVENEKVSQNDNATEDVGYTESHRDINSKPRLKNREIQSSYFYGSWKEGDVVLTLSEDGNAIASKKGKEYCRYKWTYEKSHLELNSNNIEVFPSIHNIIFVFYEDSFVYDNSKVHKYRRFTKIN
jgi:hypothetical protein